MENNNNLKLVQSCISDIISQGKTMDFIKGKPVTIYNNKYFRLNLYYLGTFYIIILEPLSHRALDKSQIVSIFGTDKIYIVNQDSILNETSHEYQQLVNFLYYINSEKGDYPILSEYKKILAGREGKWESFKIPCINKLYLYFLVRRARKFHSVYSYLEGVENIKIDMEIKANPHEFLIIDYHNKNIIGIKWKEEENNIILGSIKRKNGAYGFSTRIVNHIIIYLIAHGKELIVKPISNTDVWERFFLEWDEKDGSAHLKFNQLLMLQNAVIQKHVYLSKNTLPASKFNLIDRVLLFITKIDIFYKSHFSKSTY